MKKFITLLFASVLITSCMESGGIVLPSSIGKVNKVLVVTNSSTWLSEVGDTLKTNLSDLLVGLPQPEKRMSLSQVAPIGFNKMMKNSRNILVIEETEAETFNVTHDKYARPQTIVYLTAKDRKGLVAMVEKHREDIIKAFNDSDTRLMQGVFAKKRLDDSKYKTLQNLNISLTIPEDYRTVEDSGDFLWLRQHLKSGIAKGAGNNNLLVYSIPLTEKSKTAENVIPMRDSIGQKYLPGTKEGVYMITETLRPAETVATEVKTLKAYETRGIWELKDDWMAGPFINYSIVDEANDRLLVVEGFTYMPSVAKREFIFELEVIAKSVQIK